MQAQKRKTPTNTWTVWDWILRTLPVPEGRANERIGGTISESLKLLDLNFQSRKQKTTKEKKMQFKEQNRVEVKLIKTDENPNWISQRRSFPARVFYWKMWIRREFPNQRRLTKSEPSNIEEEEEEERFADCVQVIWRQSEVVALSTKLRDCLSDLMLGLLDSV